MSESSLQEAFSGGRSSFSLDYLGNLWVGTQIAQMSMGEVCYLALSAMGISGSLGLEEGNVRSE